MDMYGDPLGYRAELEKVFKVTPADVTRVARQYLGANRIELDILPGAPASRPAEAAVDRSKQAPVSSPALAEIKDAFDRSIMPKLGPTPHYVPPRFERRTLSNGLELRIVERHELPIVTVDLIVKSGETSAPPGKEGLASITASLIDEGTKSRDSLQIAGEQAEIGAALAAAGDLESTTVSLTTLTRHLERALDLYADIILNPSFPEKGPAPAQTPAAGAAQGSRRRCRADRRGGFPALDFRAGPSLWATARWDAQVGRVDHSGRRHRVLQADHGARQWRARGRWRHPAGSDHGRARRSIADVAPGSASAISVGRAPGIPRRALACI